MLIILVHSSRSTFVLKIYYYIINNRVPDISDWWAQSCQLNSKSIYSLDTISDRKRRESLLAKRGRLSDSGACAGTYTLVPSLILWFTPDQLSKYPRTRKTDRAHARLLPQKRLKKKVLPEGPIRLEEIKKVVIQSLLPRACVMG